MGFEASKRGYFPIEAFKSIRYNETFLHYAHCFGWNLFNLPTLHTISGFRDVVRQLLYGSVFRYGVE
jgi:hypothetical protein